MRLVKRAIFQNHIHILLSGFFLAGCYNNAHLQTQKILEEGEKAAALFWNVWGIFNKRAPYWNNKWLAYQKKESQKLDKFFPDIKRKDWYGLEGTKITEYKRVRDDQEFTTKEFDVDEDRNVSEIVMDYFESDDGEKTETYYGEEGGLYSDDQLIDNNTESIYTYEMTDEFKTNVEKFIKQIKEEILVPYEKVNPKDRAAYREAFNTVEVLGEELPH